MGYMKTIIFLFLFCCIVTLQTQATDEALIPAPLNSILLKIRPGMTTNEVERVLSASYPKFTRQIGDWSGGSGYNEYKLDKRFTLSIAFITCDGKEVVHDDYFMMLYDWEGRRRVDIKIYDWDKQGQKAPSQK